MSFENTKQKIAKKFNWKLESEIADLEFKEHKRLNQLRDKVREKQSRTSRYG